ncbi:MmcQ/YjbR family DNA-binding protein [Rhizobium sp. TH2]|uniref:MmcQ/YjbR family DNA-binding protein n=1 Tax=Rhizobium sp. TH2 TaxID=2775403 RepID=UPI0021586BEA|nr:MmcQ/YjbR family DNA-binding protein [Rhizobium sp. TH2]UVC11846.1 MmcQ/YjbR family DNA-binding protein [Rhizobium sp. TH2]
MSLFNQAQFDAFAGKQPGVAFVDQWGSRVAKVGGKVFTLLHSPGNDDANIVFKVPEESFEILTAMDGIIQAPYFAKRQWVSVSSEADLPAKDLQIYILRSYKTVAKSLTKKLRTELGIEID